MVEALHKTCNIKHEIDIKHYGNAKSETDSCQSFCFGLSFRFLSYSSLKHRLILLDGQGNRSGKAKAKHPSFSL